MFPEAARLFLGADATEERAKSIGKDVRYLHFATHSILSEQIPLSSAVVLSIPDKFEEGKENGLLQAWEIFEQVRLDARSRRALGVRVRIGQGDGRRGTDRPHPGVPVCGRPIGDGIVVEDLGPHHGGAYGPLLQAPQGRSVEGRGTTGGAGGVDPRADPGEEREGGGRGDRRLRPLLLGRVPDLRGLAVGDARQQRVLERTAAYSLGLRAGRKGARFHESPVMRNSAIGYVCQSTSCCISYSPPAPGLAAPWDPPDQCLSPTGSLWKKYAENL